jgi:ATPase subunit of ABC transporter with duplicated ATPase domains
MHTTESSTLLGRAEVPITGATPIYIDVRTGGVIFLLGANGAGKSSLIHRLKQPFGQQAVYMPGSRPSYFDNDSLSMTPSSRKQIKVNLFQQDSSPDTRWRSASGTARNEKAVHDLQSAEIGYDVSITRDIKAQGEGSPAIKRLLSRSSPLDKVNSLLEQANLPVRLLMDGSELKASRGPAVYSFARMSDGERTALLFAAEVVSAAPASVFVVDEPELHLHRSIIVPLLKALIEERKD